MNPPALLAEAERIAHRARERGADEAEAYLWHARDVEANVVGRLPSSRVSEATGLGLRVVAAGRMGHASSGRGTDALVERCIAAALLDARHAPPGHAHLPDPAPGAGPAGPWDPRIAEAEPGDVVRAASGIAQAMHAPDVRFASALVLHQAFAFAAASTRGVQVAERGTAQRLLAECRVRRGQEERTGTDTRVARRSLDAQGAGEACVERARASLGAQPVPAAQRGVLFDPATSGALFQLLAPALAGSEMLDGRSFLAGQVGKDMAAPCLTVRDAPSLGGPRAQAWDDEGAPSRDKVLVERGVLRGWMHDAASGARSGAGSTGNGLRGQEERHRAPPAVGAMSLCPEPGGKDFDALVAEADEAVVVRHAVMGLAQMNSVTGDFSLVAPSAWLVRRGEVQHALPPLTIAGRAPEALRGIVALSRDTCEGVLGILPGVWVGALATAC